MEYDALEEFQKKHVTIVGRTTKFRKFRNFPDIRQQSHSLKMM